jgi:hypothetical protein
MNKLGNGANLTNAVDVVANSVSIIQNGQVVDIGDLFVRNAVVGSVVAPVNNPQFTGNVNGVDAASVGLGNVNNTSDLNKPISTATQAALNLKANLTSLNKAGVGLGNVDNTSDLTKPISTATQTALDLKANATSLNKAGVG